MFGVGVFYLIFERRILAEAGSTNKMRAKPELDMTSRIILSLQTGLVALAMIVTRSSVITLQAREGLGIGNLYVGWFTLGEHGYA